LKFFFFLIFSLFLHALELNVNYAQNGEKGYEVLTLTNNEPILCRLDKKLFVCSFDKVPSTPVFKNSTLFFDIKPVFKDGNFSLNIKIKHDNFIIKKFEDSLYNSPFIGKEIEKAKKWVIVAGNEFINTKNKKGLDFFFKKKCDVYIGSVDEKGNPVKINTQARDVVKYFEIKKAYEKGLDVLGKIDDFLKEYPNSVFTPDVEFIKLKILDRENRSDEVIKLAKKWIKKYAFSDNLPKVLLLMGKNYSKIGFMTDASYFFQRIISEYPNTKEAYEAMIYWADQMYITGEVKKAFELYKKALYSTKDIDIASLAAVRLAQRHMDKGDIKTAFEYYKKVFSANKKFILKNPQKAFELAKTLASHQLYSLAIDIAKELVKKLKKLDPLYEPVLYNLALWTYENGNYSESEEWINRYLNEFPYGDYSDQVKTLKDKVLFQTSDGNVTQQLEKIDEIIEKYKGQEISKKALYKKIELLEKLKRYGEILKMEKEIDLIAGEYIKDKNSFIKKIATKYAQELLDKKKCEEAIKIIKKYKLQLDKKYDVKIYDCAMKSMNYKTASVVCNKYLNSADDKVFIEWMQRKIKALQALKDYKNIVTAVEDLCRVKKTGCYEYKLLKFFALWELKEYKKALILSFRLEKHPDIRNTDAFIKILRWALKNGDTLTAARFAKKIIDLQERFKAYPYSPFVEFTYAKYTKNKQEAFKVLKELLKRVKGEDRARALYMLANITGDKKYLEECVKVKDSKLWKGLCEDAMSLF